MRFSNLTPDERAHAERLLAEYCARPEHRDVALPATLRFRALCGAAARAARHGPPPNYRQRAAYRMHKKRRAKLAAIALYGDPARPDTTDMNDDTLGGRGGRGPSHE